MALTLTVGGGDRTSLLLTNSLRISSELNSRDRMSFKLRSLDGSYRPVVGNIAYLDDGGTRHFGGTIDSIEERKIWVGGAALEYDVACVDFNQLCDRRLVVGIYSGETLGAIVEDLVSQYLTDDGVTTLTFDATLGPVVQRAVFNYLSVTQCFNDLSQVTGYTWYIDYNKDLHFFAREDSTAPFGLANTSANFYDFSIRYTRDQYRNRQFIRAGYDTTVARTEEFKGDSKLRSFTLQYPIGAALDGTSITVNGGAQTVGIKQVDTGKNFYYQKHDGVIAQEISDPVLTSADTLAVTYQGLFPTMTQAYDDAEITSRAAIEGGSGVYEAVEDQPNLDDDDAALERANGLLRRYGQIQKIVTFTTRTAGLLAGQLLSVILTEHNISENFLITSVEANDENGERLIWYASAASGEEFGGWVAFFQRLAEQGKKFVVRENEVILLVRVLVDSIQVDEALAVDSGSPSSQVGTAIVGFAEVG